MTYEETLEWLYNQLPFFQKQGAGAYKPGLDRINALLEALGNPHNQVKCIHVAGTNGKGSVTHILAAIFQLHGYKTGVFTSPHITDFRERIKVNGKMIPRDFVVDFVSENGKTFKALQPSFFELTTAMAFKAFDHFKCDIAIIETGLGGRLDSTNVVYPEVSVITNIGLDHVAQLGNTLELIALEKAGIIKAHTPVVLGDVQPHLIPLFEEVANERKAPLHFSQQDTKERIATDLLGTFQQRNIRTALSVTSVLGERWNLSEKVVTKALLDVCTLTNFAGRMQQVSLRPRVILDAGHNLDGIKTILAELENFSYKSLHIIYATARDKNWREVIAEFPQDAFCYFTQFETDRALPIEEVKKEVKSNHQELQAEFFQEPSSALAASQSNSSENDLILVCGSFYLLEKINQLFLEKDLKK